MQRLPEHELHRFVFEKGQFSPYVREFTWQGHIYDVVRYAESDGEIEIYCYDDTKEQAMRDDYKKALAQKHKRDKEKTAKEWQSFKLICLYYPSIEHLVWAVPVFKTSKGGLPRTLLPASYHPFLLKPPQRCSGHTASPRFA